MMNTQTDCYSLVWENPIVLNDAVRRNVRFERDFFVPDVPIEISSESPLEISSQQQILNPVNDAYVILQTLARAGKIYRSIVVLHKGIPIVRWMNSNKPATPLDLVIDARDVSNSVALERSFELNRWLTLISLGCFVCVTLMFIHVAARTSAV